MHFYSWKKGLKTGIYYLRSQAKTSAQKFSVDLEKGVSTGGNANGIGSSSSNSKDETLKENVKTNIQEKEEPECIMCSS